MPSTCERFFKNLGELLLFSFIARHYRPRLRPRRRSSDDGDPQNPCSLKNPALPVVGAMKGALLTPKLTQLELVRLVVNCR